MLSKSIKAFKQGNSIVVVIPSSFADFLEIGDGDFLIAKIKGKQLIYEKTPFTDD